MQVAGSCCNGCQTTTYTPNNKDSWVAITTTTSESTSEQENNYFKLIEEERIRELLSDTFLWLSGMGEYPELLAQVAPDEIVGDVHSKKEDERDMVAAKTVVQVLRWVLGEI
jgi:hypothetical protein